MFELAVIVVLIFAIAYWAILWQMGRRDDVLHGQFVGRDPEPTPFGGTPASFDVTHLKSLLQIIERDLRG